MLASISLLWDSVVCIVEYSFGVLLCVRMHMLCVHVCACMCARVSLAGEVPTLNVSYKPQKISPKSEVSQMNDLQCVSVHVFSVCCCPCTDLGRPSELVFSIFLGMGAH